LAQRILHRRSWPKRPVFIVRTQAVRGKSSRYQSCSTTMSVMPRPVQVLSALMFSSNWLGIVHLCSELYPMGRQFEPVSLMKHLFNSPGMHTWQHFYELPKSRYFETNFGFIPPFGTICSEQPTFPTVARASDLDSSAPRNFSMVLPVRQPVGSMKAIKAGPLANLLPANTCQLANK